MPLKAIAFFISICIIAFYIPKLCSFSFIYLFVREYYFGL